MSISQEMRTMLSYAGKKPNVLVGVYGVSRQAICNKFKRDNWLVSEVLQAAEICNATLNVQMNEKTEFQLNLGCVSAIITTMLNSSEITKSSLGELFGISRQAVHNKFTSEHWTVDDLIKIADKCGARVVVKLYGDEVILPLSLNGVQAPAEPDEDVE